MTMQASYDDLPKSQRRIQGAPELELDAEDSPQFRLHNVENTSSLKHKWNLNILCTPVSSQNRLQSINRPLENKF